MNFAGINLARYGDAFNIDQIAAMGMYGQSANRQAEVASGTKLASALGQAQSLIDIAKTGKETAQVAGGLAVDQGIWNGITGGLQAAAPGIGNMLSKPATPAIEPSQYWDASRSTDLWNRSAPNYWNSPSFP